MKHVKKIGGKPLNKKWMNKFFKRRKISTNVGNNLANYGDGKNALTTGIRGASSIASTQNSAKKL